MDEHRRTLSREQVIKTERRAWTRPTGARGGEYYFDGINFWRYHGHVDAELVAPWRAPVSGWQHRAGCRCRECSPRAVA